MLPMVNRLRQQVGAAPHLAHPAPGAPGRRAAVPAGIKRRPRRCGLAALRDGGVAGIAIGVTPFFTRSPFLTSTR